MLEKYKTIYTRGLAEIVEKKSRFIANVDTVKSQEEATAYINEMRKRYADARHNCYAYVIGEHKELTRCSDDGEPSSTAGRPILDIILNADLYDTIVVVTRYFGGTLLGTGGLVRAYSAAAQAGIQNSVVIEKVHAAILAIRTEYQDVGKIQYLLGEKKLPITDSVYTQDVIIKALVPSQKVSGVTEDLIEATGARAQIEKERELYYADSKNGPILFDSI
ncbi:MAG: YigZ family protein [Lachnospiraceae bacterium]